MPSPNLSLKKDSSSTTPHFSLFTPHSFLITGGCGFIGTSLIKNLVTEGGHFIRVLDNLSVGTRDDLGTVCDFSEVNISSLSKDSSLLTPNSSLKKDSSLLTSHSLPAPQVELIVGDIRDPATAEACCRNTDVIVHLAANTGVGPSVEDPEADMKNNVIGTFNMLEAARHHGVKRFIFASSGAPAGECEPPIHEELAPHPVSPYGASKLAGEGYCSAYYKTFGVETVSLRFGNVYGPSSGHKNSVVAKFIKQAMNGEILEIYGDGTQTRDFIYIDDLIRAVKLAQATPNIGGETFQIATNKETTVSEMVEILIPSLNRAGILDIQIKHGEKQVGDVMRNYSDTSKAQRLLGWEAEVELVEGLERTVEWFTNL